MTVASAHPNIALIKYWGKGDGPGNLPATPSLSITLNDLRSTTEVSTADRGPGGRSRDTVLLDGEVVDDAKINACLATLRRHYDVPPIHIRTGNNFPTAAGLASSASGFAALITAVNAHCNLGMTDAERSDFARQASGSAARSIYGGFVGLSGPDWIAEPLLDADAWPMAVVIAITDTARKTVSSTEGMRRSEATSAYYGEWVRSTAVDYDAARIAVTGRNFDDLALLAETSCLKMHGVMQSSVPPMIYWRPATVACMEAVHALRAEGRSVFFTIDAGPQVKAVCAPDDAPAVAERLQSVDGVLSLRTVGLGGGAVVTGP